MTPPIVIELDIIKHCCPHYFLAGKILSVDKFHLQCVEEAFRTGIVVTTAFGTHTALQISSGNPLNSTDHLCLYAR